MSKAIDKGRKIEMLKAELKKLEESVSKAEDLCFTVLNAAQKATEQEKVELQNLKQQEKEIIQILGTSDGNILEVYNAQVADLTKSQQKLERKIQRAQNQLNINEKQIGSVKNFADALRADLPSIKSTFSSLRETVVLIQSMIGQANSMLLSSISATKAAVMHCTSMTQRKREEEAKKLGERMMSAERMIKDISEGKVTMKERVSIAEPSSFQRISEPEAVAEECRSVGRIFMGISSRVNRMMSEFMSGTEERISAMGDRIVNVNQKVDRYRKSEAVATFAKILKSSLLFTKIQRASNAASRKWNSEAEAKEQMNSNSEKKRTEKIGETGKTASDIYAEIEGIKADTSVKRKNSEMKIREIRDRNSAEIAKMEEEIKKLEKQIRETP